jgi:hypothetical protein
MTTFKLNVQTVLIYAWLWDYNFPAPMQYAKQSFAIFSDIQLNQLKHN